MDTSEKKATGRPCKYKTPEEKVAAMKRYNKEYYETKIKVDGKYKYDTTRKSTINNAIERLIRSDKYIMQLIEKVGKDKILDLINMS